MLLQQLELGLEKKAGINYAPPGNKRLIYFVGGLRGVIKPNLNDPNGMDIHSSILPLL